LPAYYQLSNLTSFDSYISNINFRRANKNFYIVGGVEEEQTSSGTVRRPAFDSLSGDISRSTKSDFNYDYLRLDLVIVDEDDVYILGSDPLGGRHWYHVTYLGNIGTGSGSSYNINTNYITLSGNPGAQTSVTIKHYIATIGQNKSCSIQATWGDEYFLTYSYYVSYGGYGTVEDEVLAAAVGGRDGGYVVGGKGSKNFECQQLTGSTTAAGFCYRCGLLIDKMESKLYYLHPNNFKVVEVDFTVKWPDGVELTVDSVYTAFDVVIQSKRYFFIVYKTGGYMYRIAARPADELLSGLPPLPVVYGNQYDFYYIYTNIYGNSTDVHPNQVVNIATSLSSSS